MACELCGRGSCTRSFHSIKDQEAFDNKTGKYAPPCEECESLKHALAAKEAELVAVKKQLQVYLDWDDSDDECFDITHATLHAEVARVREALREALVIMRNYYGHAISRAAVEEFITKSQQHIQPSRGEQG